MKNKYQRRQLIYSNGCSLKDDRGHAYKTQYSHNSKPMDRIFSISRTIAELKGTYGPLVFSNHIPWEPHPPSGCDLPHQKFPLS